MNKYIIYTAYGGKLMVEADHVEEDGNYIFFCTENTAEGRKYVTRDQIFAYRNMNTNIINFYPDGRED